MKKNLLIIAILLSIIAFALFFGKKKFDSQNSVPDVQNEVLESEFNYKNNMRMLAYKDGIIIYDGRQLCYKNEKFENKFDISIKCDSFVLKTSQDDSILLLDKPGKILYKIDSSGNVISQTKFMENGVDVYPLKNSYVILHYNTDVKTDGLIIYKPDLQSVNNISYPNGLVNAVTYDEWAKKIYVSVQLLDYTKVINAIYSYNEKYEVEEIKQFQNLVTTDMIVTGSHILISDPQTVYVMDKTLSATGKIDAQDSFSNVAEVEGKLYLQDGGKIVRVMNKDANLIEEMAFDEPVEKICFAGTEPVFLGKNFVKYKDEKTDIKRDIMQSAITKDKKLILLSRNSYTVLNLKK